MEVQYNEKGGQKMAEVYDINVLQRIFWLRIGSFPIPVSYLMTQPYYIKEMLYFTHTNEHIGTLGSNLQLRRIYKL